MKPGPLFSSSIVGFSLFATVGTTSISAQPPPSPTASPTPDPLVSIEGAFRAEREAVKQKADEAAASSHYTAENFDASHRYLLEQVRQQLLRGEDEAAVNSLLQIRAAATGESLVKTCDALIDQLRKARAEKEAALEKEADALLKRAGDEVLRAKDPKDLDDTLRELTRLAGTRIRHNSTDDNVGRVLNRLQAAVSFVNRWQDYLFSLRRGDETATANILRGLSDNNSSNGQFPLVPRSEILSRLPASRSLEYSSSTAARSRPTAETNAAVAAILDATHTLDDVPAAVQKLDKIRRDFAADAASDLTASLDGLQGLQKAWLEVQSGLATTINLTAMRGESFAHPAVEDRLIPLRAELVSFALPRVLDAPDAKPAAGEGTVAFLRRLIDAARQRADWATVLRGLEISRSLSLSQGVSLSDDYRETEAVKDFLSGLNLEAAGQHEQAVITLLRALKSGVPNLPAALIGEHLDAIEKAHPKEFADAKSFVLNPPAQAYPGGPTGPYGPNNGPFGPHGPRGVFDPATGQFQQPTPVAVQVPAASPTPKPPPSPRAP